MYQAIQALREGNVHAKPVLVIGLKNICTEPVELSVEQYKQRLN